MQDENYSLRPIALYQGQTTSAARSDGEVLFFASHFAPHKKA